MSIRERRLVGGSVKRVNRGPPTAVKPAKVGVCVCVREGGIVGMWGEAYERRYSGITHSVLPMCTHCMSTHRHEGYYHARECVLMSVEGLYVNSVVI